MLWDWVMALSPMSWLQFTLEFIGHHLGTWRGQPDSLCTEADSVVDENTVTLRLVALERHSIVSLIDQPCGSGAVTHVVHPHPSQCRAHHCS